MEHGVQLRLKNNPNRKLRILTDTSDRNLKSIHHRATEYTELYDVNCSCGAIDNTKLFSVLSVSLW